MKETRGEAEEKESKRKGGGGNGLSQMEVSAPGLLPYEGEVLCDEAEKAVVSTTPTARRNDQYSS